MSREIQSKKANFCQTAQLVVPDQLYYSIGDVAKYLQIRTHVLRYWEHHIKQLAPVKRQGRRYYNKTHIELLKKIRYWLYELGYTVEGVKKKLSDDPKSMSHAQTVQLIRGLEGLSTSLACNDDQLLTVLASE